MDANADVDIVIASAVRTPIGSFQGALAELEATDLGAIVLREAVARAGAEPEAVERAFMGSVIQAGLGQGPARQAVLKAGLPFSVAAITLNKVCGSGLQAVMTARRELMVGDVDVVLAGGMESMTNAPYLLPGARQGQRLGDGKLVDALLYDALRDPTHGIHVGQCGDLAASEYGISREAQDDFALQSYERALRAQESGSFKDEIVRVEIPQRKGDPRVVEHDEEPANLRRDKVRSLRPAFEKDGTVTAANASTLNDGAAALLLCRRSVAESRGYEVLARIVADATFAQEPKWFTTAPVEVLRRLYEKTGTLAVDWDLYEINEAFGVVTMIAIRELGLDPERVNVNGGAVALGHPVGCSGARILVTLIHALRNRSLRRGIAALCIGGGEAVAVAVELV